LRSTSGCELLATAQPAAVSAAAQEPAAIERSVKVIGPLRISIPLFSIYLSEADELSRRLTTEVAEWAMELNRPSADGIDGSFARWQFGKRSASGTVGWRQLEHCCAHRAIGSGSPDEGRLLSTPPTRSVACCTSSRPDS
jgi:chemosensory pili system protein ChpA (sensor histidine kinase/response regulator)